MFHLRMPLCQRYENQVKTDRQVAIRIAHVGISRRHGPPDFPLIHSLLRIDQEVHATCLDFHNHQLIALACHQIQLIMMPMPILFQDQITLLLQELASHTLTLTAYLKCGWHTFVCLRLILYRYSRN